VNVGFVVCGEAEHRVEANLLVGIVETRDERLVGLGATERADNNDSDRSLVQEFWTSEFL
jgi:hypothetical protein